MLRREPFLFGSLCHPGRGVGDVKKLLLAWPRTRTQPKRRDHEKSRLESPAGIWISIPGGPGGIHQSSSPVRSLFVWLVADGWCWFVLREK
jgi:hypothetical protein